MAKNKSRHAQRKRSNMRRKEKLWAGDITKKRRCYYCGTWLEYSEATVDHKTPKIRGGSNNKIENLCISCKRCNFVKAFLTEVEFMLVKSSLLKDFDKNFYQRRDLEARRRKLEDDKFRRIAKERVKRKRENKERREKLKEEIPLTRFQKVLKGLGFN